MASNSLSNSGDVQPAAEKLKNRYFVIRHGEAESNVKRVLVSKPEIGIPHYGLTDKGKQQAEQAAESFKTILQSEQNLDKKLVIVSSDFRRARETAEILHAKLNVQDPIRFEPALRERGLGELVEYDSVHQMWALDNADPTHNEFSVESVMEVVVRMSRIIQQLDKEYTERIVILVSHGDPCQCIHTVFMGISPNEFRKSPGMANCEIRELKDNNN